MKADLYLVREDRCKRVTLTQVCILSCLTIQGLVADPNQPIHYSRICLASFIVTLRIG
jgi:hypothetical protein